MSETVKIQRRSKAERVNRISDKRANDAHTQGLYQPYKDAEWGFINHWYPALLAKSLRTAQSQVSRCVVYPSCCVV